jgi:hypothetical protein
MGPGHRVQWQQPRLRHDTIQVFNDREGLGEKFATVFECRNQAPVVGQVVRLSMFTLRQLLDKLLFNLLQIQCNAHAEGCRAAPK